MFRALLAHPQEALYKRHLVYCVHVMSVGCTRTGVEVVSQVVSIACLSSGGAIQVALCILHACYVSWLHQDWSGTGVFDTKSASRWFHYTD
jgi:hypothetical protein